MNNLTKQEVPGSDLGQVNSTVWTINHTQLSPFLTEDKGAETLPNLFCDVSTALLPKPEEHIRRK